MQSQVCVSLRDVVNGVRVQMARFDGYRYVWRLGLLDVLWPSATLLHELEARNPSSSRVRYRVFTLPAPSAHLRRLLQETIMALGRDLMWTKHCMFGTVF